MSGSNLLRWSAGCTLALLVGGCATARNKAAAPSSRSCAQLEGTWDGVLTVRSEANGADPTGSKARTDGGDLKLRLAFSSGSVSVYVDMKGRWTAVKPESFSVRCDGPSAIAHAVDSGKDEDGTWFESLMISVTVRERHELFTHWSRMVNNVDLPSSNADSRFTYNALGVLRRAELPDACAPPDDPEALGNQTVGQFLSDQCRCGYAGSCELLAMVLEIEGGVGNLERASALMAEACRLGVQDDCSSRPPRAAPGLVRADVKPLPPASFSGLEKQPLRKIVERLGPARRETGSVYCVLAWPVDDGREFFVATHRCDPSENAVNARF